MPQQTRAVKYVFNRLETQPISSLAAWHYHSNEMIFPVCEMPDYYLHPLHMTLKSLFISSSLFILYQNILHHSSSCNLGSLGSKQINVYNNDISIYFIGYLELLIRLPWQRTALKSE